MKNNKFFKKFAATFLAVAILLASAPLSGFAGLDFLDLFNISASAYFRASGACGDAVSWEVNFETDVMIVSGNGTMLNYSDTSRSPWYDYSGDIEIVTIEEGVTNIGNYAFNNCSYLRKITIPESVTSIGDYAFAGCDDLTDVYFPGTQEQWNSIQINSNNDLLLNATIHYNEVNTVFDGTFAGLDWSVNTSTGEFIINGNGTIIEGLSSFRAPWFTYSSYIKKLTIGEGIDEIESNAFRMLSNLTSVTLPKSLCAIRSSAFSYCKSLTDINFPENLQSIGGYAFENCRNLTIVKIPKSVTSIGSYAFNNCDSLKDVFYVGTEEEWKKITIGSCNNDLIYANIYYNEDENEKVLTGTCGKNLTWTLDKSTGELKVEGTGYMYGYSYMGGSSHSSRPWEKYKNLITTITICEGVTNIGSHAFSYCTRLTSITIPDSVTSIGTSAFLDCSNLTSITIPDSVTSIGYWAFLACESLTSITIPDSVTSISSAAFIRCTNLTGITVSEGNTTYWSDEYGILFNKNKTELIRYPEGIKQKSYTIPDSVTSIGDDAFNRCTSLTSITIPDSVTSIGDDAFYNCENLTSITIPDSVTSIGDGAFCGCTSLTSITIPYGVTSISDDAFFRCESLTSITIPDSVTSIGDDAFYNCDSLTSITIPDSVTSIGDSAFYNCDSLTSITIPDSVTSISDDAFYRCESLTSVTIPCSVTSIGSFAFYDCASLTSITIPDSVTSIGDDAFLYCTSLTSITIPDSVTSIGYYAFYNTGYYNDSSNWEDDVLYIGNHLIEANTSISGAYTIKEGTMSIGSSAFRGCTSLTSITIPDSVTSISSSAFYKCTSLTSITIPDSVTSIGDEVFYNCNSLRDVYFGGTEAEWDNIAIASNNEELLNATIHFAEDEKETVVTGTCGENLTWSFDEETATLTIEGTGDMYDYDWDYDSPPWYEYRDSITNVTICEGVTSIGRFAFTACTSLISITIPDSVTSIGYEALRNCTSLTSITIPDSVTNIDFFVFYNCTSLKNVTIPDSVTSIGDSAFSDCTSLTSITIPDSVTSIDSCAFSYCTSLTSITIPDGVRTIDACTFNFCKSLTSITIPDSVTRIGYSAFSDCTSLTSITIPDSVTSIGDDAFNRCTSLTSITIPDSVTSIGDEAFYNCNSLRDVYFGGTEAEWDNIAIASNNEELLNATIHFAGSEHEHSYESEITTQPTCTAEGVETFVCECGNSYTQTVPEKGHTLSHITVDSTCKVAGMEYDLCSECEVVLNSNTLPLMDHTWGEWTVTAEPTTENEGTKTRTCSVCSEEETESIPKLEVIVNEETGIEIVFGEEYGDGVEVQASEVYDGKSFQLVEANYGNVKTTIFDISTTVDGVAVQPEGKVKVRIPLPEGFGAGKVVVCYVDSENGKVTSIPAKVVDGYVEFETDHFSHYALLATKGKVYSVKIDDVSLYYKDTMFIFPKIKADDGVKYTVEYSSSKPSVAEINQNGQITAKSFGRTTITCTVTDEYGNTVTESFKVNVKYTVLQWIIKLFLFGDLWYY